MNFTENSHANSVFRPFYCAFVNSHNPGMNTVPCRGISSCFIKSKIPSVNPGFTKHGLPLNLHPGINLSLYKLKSSAQKANLTLNSCYWSSEVVAWSDNCLRLSHPPRLTSHGIAREWSVIDTMMCSERFTEQAQGITGARILLGLSAWARPTGQRWPFINRSNWWFQCLLCQDPSHTHRLLCINFAPKGSEPGGLWAATHLIMYNNCLSGAV